MTPKLWAGFLAMVLSSAAVESQGAGNPEWKPPRVSQDEGRWDITWPRPVPRYASPRRWSFEFRVGAYRPAFTLPAETATSGRAQFRADRTDPVTQIEIAHIVEDSWGSLSFGAMAGYLFSRGQFAQPFALGKTEKVFHETADLQLIPVSLSAIFRFDDGARRSETSFIPYVKAGVDRFFWRLRLSDGWISDASDGWHAGVGLALRLDEFDPRAAKRLDVEAGINNTHIFVEGTRYEIVDFGKKNGAEFRTLIYSAGLMFEF